LPESESKISVYPNPVENKFTITLQSKITEYTTAELYNTEGKLIEKQSLYNSTSTIDLSGFPAGMYLVKVDTGTEILTEKIIKN
jgi:hypothetical protein